MNCMLCGHRCGADRAENETGFCSMGETAVLSKVMLHKWEEPCISGTNGSGAIFFAGCSLRCAFCQNWEISHMRKGLPVDIDRLRDIFDELADQGAHNINLVNPTHFVPFIQKAFKRYQKRIPVVYNTHGYDSLDALHRMDGIVDVYLPDLKYALEKPAWELSCAGDYFPVAAAAIVCTCCSRRNRSSASRTDCDRSETGKTRLPRSVFSGQRRDSKNSIVSSGVKRCSALIKKRPPRGICCSASSGVQ